VGLMAGLNRCGKSRFRRDSIPGPSSPERVAIPTELSRPTFSSVTFNESPSSDSRLVTDGQT
jgi:hypothetical protein